jgi:LacI family transcriptional regulator
MRKPTLYDVARTAGLSYATVDRVLNGRGGVAQKSVQRVRQAVDALGYQRDELAAMLSRRRSYRFRFHLPAGDHGFYRALRAAVDAEALARRGERVEIVVAESPALDADALAAGLEALEHGDCHGVAVVAVDTPRVARAIARLAELGIPVVTLVSDAGVARAAHVGIDNLVAGRTAGRLVEIAHRGRGGRVLPVIGALTQTDHRDRLSGATEVLAVGGIEILPALTVQDRSDLMAAMVGEALAATPGVSGIYSIGAGNRGLIPVLAGLGARRPFVVLHELTPFTRAALGDGLIDAVIDQNPRREVALGLDAMKAIADGRTGGALTVTPAIYLRDNLPPEAASGGTI